MSYYDTNIGVGRNLEIVLDPLIQYLIEDRISK